MTYVFDFIDPAGRIVHFDLVHCPSDSEAEHAAATSLHDSRAAVRVEVWAGARRVTDLGRTRDAA